MSEVIPDKTFHISPKQLAVLIEVAGSEAVSVELNLPDSEGLVDVTATKKQLDSLIVRAAPEAVRKALIQNGNTPTAFK